jgi:hypothetical protein
MTDTPEVPNPDDSLSPRKRLTLVDMQAIGQHLRTQVEASMTPKRDCLERPYILASMLRTPADQNEVLTYDLERLVDACVAMGVGPLVERYVKLHDDLTAHGHVDRDTKFEFGNDAYVWAVPERFAPKKDLGINFKHIFGDDYEPDEPDPKARRAKAIVLQTQSCNFLLVMNYDYGRWSRMDVREFWPDIREQLANKDYLLNLNDIKDRTDLTVLDLVRYSTRAATYSDDFEDPYQYTRVERPSLATLLKGTLMAGEEDSGKALRYGDFRDAGFVVSVTLDREDEGAEAEKMIHTRLSHLNYVGYNMASAIYVLSEAYPATPGT